MSSLKRFDINSKDFSKDWPIFLKCDSFKENMTLEELKKIKENMQKKDYTVKNNNVVLITEYYYTTNTNEVNNLLKVIIEKDLKTAKIEIIKMSSNIKEFIIKLVNTLFTTDNLEDIFVFLNKNEKNTINNLLNKGFISLEGNDEKYIPLMIERKI